MTDTNPKFECKNNETDNNNNTSRHDFVQNNIQPSIKFSPNCATIVVGKSGVGKSSLISLLCDDSVAKPETSSKPTPCTQIPELYPCAAHKNELFLDSPGTDDPDKLDGNTRCAIFRKLFTNKIQKIKVIWIVYDVTRSSTSLLQQAEYIESLAPAADSDSKTANIWDSCLIILKKGELKPRIKKGMHGVVNAAKQHGLVIRDEQRFSSQHLLGYTAIEWPQGGDEEDEGDEGEEDTWHYLPPSVKVKKGYLCNNEIKQNVRQLLLNLKPCVIRYKNEICTKCSAKGDSRYIVQKCHTTPHYRHLGTLKPSEHEHTEWRHLGEYGKVSALETCAIVGGGIVVAGLAAGAIGLGASAVSSGSAAWAGFAAARNAALIAVKAGLSADAAAAAAGTAAATANTAAVAATSATAAANVAAAAATSAAATSTAASAAVTTTAANAFVSTMVAGIISPFVAAHQAVTGVMGVAAAVETATAAASASAAATATAAATAATASTAVAGAASTAAVASTAAATAATAASTAASTAAAATVATTGAVTSATTAATAATGAVTSVGTSVAGTKGLKKAVSDVFHKWSCCGARDEREVGPNGCDRYCLDCKCRIETKNANSNTNTIMNKEYCDANRKYTCCGKKQDVEKCTVKSCKKCDRPWGTPGCTD